MFDLILMFDLIMMFIKSYSLLWIHVFVTCNMSNIDYMINILIKHHIHVIKTLIHHVVLFTFHFQRNLIGQFSLMSAR